MPCSVFWTILTQPFSTPLDTGDILARLLAAVWRFPRRQRPGTVADMPNAFPRCCGKICIRHQLRRNQRGLQVPFPAVPVLHGAFPLTNECALPPPPFHVWFTADSGCFSLLSGALANSRYHLRGLYHCCIRDSRRSFVKVIRR